jgi:biotin carboxylase
MSALKLLALEACQNAEYYRSRYEQVESFGAELYVLNGEGRPGYWPAERYRIVGSSQIDDIIAAAAGWHAAERFDGVITFSESAVVAVAAVAESLGLPGIGRDAARNCRNKLLMRQAHARGGAPHPRFRLVTDLHQARAAAGVFGYPVILKPTLGAASNFVFRIDTPEQLDERFAQVAEGILTMSWFEMEAKGLDLGPAGILVESFLDGRELLIEALAWDGEVFLGSVVDRVTAEGETFDDDVHRAPTTLSPDALVAVHRAVEAGARAQGLHRSVMHAEVRFHRGEPHLLEIAVRPGGGGLDMIARLTAGYCPIRAVMDVARGVKPQVRHYEPTGVHVAAMCLISEPGRVARVDIPAEVSESPQTFILKITAQPGDVIRRPPDGNSIIGFLGTTGESEEHAMSTMSEFADLITVSMAG